MFIQAFAGPQQGLGVEMKLRMKGDSVRVRVAPSEVERLCREGRIEEAVRFSLQPEETLRYSITLDRGIDVPEVHFIDHEVRVLLPREAALKWAASDAVSLGGEVPLDAVTALILLVEKDFACLDVSDEENADTYPNPNAGLTC